MNAATAPQIKMTQGGLYYGYQFRLPTHWYLVGGSIGSQRQARADNGCRSGDSGFLLWQRPLGEPCATDRLRRVRAALCRCGALTTAVP
jgi:hypothetical protein